MFRHPHVAKQTTVALLTILCLACFIPQRSAHAFAHLWQIKEVFTNASGSVQFVEMFTTGPSEVFTSGGELTVNDGADKTFTLDHDLSGSTGNRHLLFATPGFAAAAGITPDFTFPSAPFFNPNATNFSVDFSYSGDTINFTGASLPKNGLNSLTDTNANVSGSPNLVSGDNSPTNLNNQVGHVNAVPEPLASALLAMGILSLQFTRRKRE